MNMITECADCGQQINPNKDHNCRQQVTRNRKRALDNGESGDRFERIAQVREFFETDWDEAERLDIFFNG